MGPERTIEQAPAFAFQIIVYIAIKALSPAIDDPTTAVRGIDRIHRLLRVFAARDLGDAKIGEGAGRVRLVFPTPDWEDFVRPDVKNASEAVLLLSSGKSVAPQGLFSFLYGEVGNVFC